MSRTKKGFMTKRPYRRGRKAHFRSKSKCRICKREVDYGDLCYYCRKRRLS